MQREYTNPCVCCARIQFAALHSAPEEASSEISKTQEKKHINWSKQCNKERDKENSSKEYKILLQTQEFGNITHQIHVKANVCNIDSDDEARTDVELLVSPQ